VRLFVALEVPAAVRREVGRRMAGLRERLPRARWVDPEAIHLTLLFLGEVAAGRAPALAAALAAACAPHPPLALRLAGGGTFPPGRPARVAWVGLAAPADLAALQADAVRAAVASAGFEPEKRPYHPHVTLARCPLPWPRGAAEKFVAAFPAEVGPPWIAGRGVLMESKLSPRGSRYQVLADLPLAGEGAEDS
jgi:RNA 2',3'-cyclic 3'-phosphodiesterase